MCCPGKKQQQQNVEAPRPHDGVRTGRGPRHPRRLDGVGSCGGVRFVSVRFDRGSSSIITLVASTSAVMRAGERVQLAGAPVVMDADIDRIITRDGADISARAKALAEASSEFRQRRRGTACADGTRALVIASLAVVFVGALVGFVLHMYT